MISWQEFSRGKWGKGDIHEFALHLEDHLFPLHRELLIGRYRHGAYTPFYITDPKIRHIHKAQVRDRLVHHAIFRILYQLFDRSFIFDSYSCRLGKGTHRAIERLRVFLRKESNNITRPVYVLKCDVRRFFDSVDHNVLLELLWDRLGTDRVMKLLEQIIVGFEVSKGKGIPLGNVTSQLFANIYLNELDQFVKHVLKATYYIRYCDDFVIISHDKVWLGELIMRLQEFLSQRLCLELHPKKVSIRKWSQGIDFLGYISLPDHTIVRPLTRKRMMNKLIERIHEFQLGRITKERLESTRQSYLGMLGHCNARRLEEVIKKMTM
ncbi:MAG: reverse transcriptase/maturase family protein [bacterium]|nr:reverse transcriptase/maturase family protein [bacterium]